ncbi:MAG TPA: redox-regulated ATPase YchF [Candidatus Thermoplasmatota archaeon]|nr:redox-regulated ATPase YchF [Candidatus Thermoplasmatota archaeon]
MARAPVLVGLVGKPNVGKSTFYSASTKAPAEIANYPFTTIEPNRGVAYLRTPCPHVALGLASCTPRTGKCVDGVRWVPTEVLDVAGLVPDAHAGKGRGNQFLDDLRGADALIHVIDVSGSTDAEGNPVPLHTRDPAQDVTFLENEIDHWIAGIVGKNWGSLARGMTAAGGKKVETIIGERVTGLGITEVQVRNVLTTMNMPSPVLWKEDDLFRVAHQLRLLSKPILVALNKADLADDATVARLRKANAIAIPTSANAELALRKAADAGVLRYEPGDKDFTIVDDGKLNAAQKKGLEHIREKVMKRFGGTGVQEILERAVYEGLDRIVAYPVEDETHYTDKDGRVLPDAHLLKRGATAKELAAKVHTDLAKNFIRAIDAKRKRAVGAEHALETGDVIRIVAAK